MRKYRRHRLDLGESDVLGDGTMIVRVVGDPEWVHAAIDQAWFSIGKTRGTWRVFLPYTEFFDLIGNSTRCENAHRNTDHYIECVHSVLAQQGIRYRASTGLSNIGLFRVKFYTREQVKQFVFLMQMNGCTYIEKSRINHGPR